jgi:hypothetical protein
MSHVLEFLRPESKIIDPAIVLSAKAWYTRFIGKAPVMADDELVALFLTIHE